MMLFLLRACYLKIDGIQLRNSWKLGIAICRIDTFCAFENVQVLCYSSLVFSVLKNECKLPFFGWIIWLIVGYCLGSEPSHVSLFDDYFLLIITISSNR